MQCGFEDDDCIVLLAPVIAVGKRGVDNTRTRELSSATSASRRLRVFALAAPIAAAAAALAAA